MKKLFLVLVSCLTWSSFSAVENGKMAPEFTLKSHEGKDVSLADFKGKYVVLEWYNKDCPFVRKHYDPKNMQGLQGNFNMEKEVVWLNIISSAPGNQGYLTAQEAAENYKKEGKKSFKVLLDPTGKVGRTYGAKTTPHMYIIDKKGMLAYQGAIDSNPSYKSSDIKGAKNYVSEAFSALLEERAVAQAKTKPYGCSVKY